MSIWMQYDRADRLVSQTGDGAAISAQYNANDELTGDGTQSKQYDATGNRTGSGTVVGPGNEVRASAYQFD